MRRVVVAAGLAALGAVVLAIPASGAQSIVFHVDDVHGTAHFNRAHNVLNFRGHLVSHRNHSRHLGHSKGRCRIKSRAKAHCRVVYSFRNGKVKTDGRVLLGRKRDRDPVVGGTGVYNGVGGKVIAFRGRESDIHLKFVLVK